MALGFDVRGDSPFNLGGGPSETLFRFDIEVDLNKDGSLGNTVRFKDEKGTSHSMTLKEWNDKYLNADVNRKKE
ncbi:MULTISPECIES: hypothetical protein [unclassified Chitinophaga]|uniref:hypothetical protein n=1 Tax=unclassified Chitinophaga TaxID=2619133 RepID=UPI0009CC8D80|nr:MULTISPECIES: hypothetical protein [unclassified Chitinophaga]OMP75972.1 hypothetical protein BW716_27550 [[Flexibacter] sp. ATCC 35208]WPV64303.1 hypothetical protein QQL36_21110 [Chitinophaga sp. LS1]